MSTKRKMTFTDEDGNKIHYTIIDQLLINKSEYVIMSPENSASNPEFYKINFDSSLNETLSLVENEREISMIKKAAHLQ